jgi:hypothetical protein
VHRGGHQEDAVDAAQPGGQPFLVAEQIHGDCGAGNLIAPPTVDGGLAISSGKEVETAHLRYQEGGRHVGIGTREALEHPGEPTGFNLVSQQRDERE